jgi:hypothetical protein
MAGEELTDPKGYVAGLLSLLGDDDPAEAQAAAPAQIRALIVDAADDLRTRPKPGEWSVLGCVAHIADAELVSSARYRWIVAHDQPPLAPYDQDLWVERLHDADEDPEALLATFEALRAANLDLWRRSSDEDKARVGMHAERGPESYDLTFRMLAGHDRLHLGQARDALEQARAGRG